LLDAYLIQAVKFYAQNGKSGRKYIPVERSNLESVTLQIGSIPGVDASEYGITEEKYPNSAKQNHLYFHKENFYPVTDTDGVTVHTSGRYILIVLFEGRRINTYREKTNDLLTQSEFYQQHLFKF